jgi:hypothetical protein
MRERQLAVNDGEEDPLALSRSDLSRLDVKTPDGIPLEAHLGRLVPADFRQARAAVALSAAMQGGAARMRDVRLQRVR